MIIHADAFGIQRPDKIFFDNATLVGDRLDQKFTYAGLLILPDTDTALSASTRESPPLPWGHTGCSKGQ